MIFRRQVMAVKREGTAGTAETPAAGDGTINVYNVDVTSDHEVEFLEGQNTGAHHTGIVQQLPWGIGFLTKAYPTSTAAVPDWGLLVEMCGFAVNSTTLTPTLGTTTTGTFSEYIGEGTPLLLKGAGCAGSFVLSGEGGKAPEFNWTFMGKRVAPTTPAIITPTYNTVAPYNWSVDDVAVLGVTGLKVRSFSFDLGARATRIIDANAADRSGIYAAQVADWDPTLTITIKAQTGTDFYAYAVNATTGACTFNFDTSTRSLQLSLPKCQLMGDPKFVNIDGIAHHELRIKPLQSTVQTSDFCKFIWS